MLSRVLALREKVLTLEHLDTLQSMNNLAGVLSERGKHEEAETLYRVILNILSFLYICIY